MSEDPMAATSDCGGDAAAYVLGALEPDEAEEFRRHMESCVVCRDEVFSLQHVADALPMAAPQYPAPRRLRHRVLSAVHAEAASPARPRAWLPRPALAAGLAAVLALATVGGIELASRGGPGTRIIAASLGAAHLRLSGTHAELVVDHLAAPAPGHIYEVWLQRAGQPPAPTEALFSVTAGGAAEVGVPGNLRGVTAVLVTQERNGGSRVPTTAPVIVAHL
jgi:anti-sigma factor RsiW